METVVGLYKNHATARMVIQELLDYGIERENINVTKEHGTNGNQQESAQEPTSTPDASSNISLNTLSALTVAGMRPLMGVAPIATPVAAIGNITTDSVGEEIPEDDVEPYNINTSEGGTLVTVETPNKMVSHVADMMGRYRDLELKHGNEVPDEASLNTESNTLTQERSEIRQADMEGRAATQERSEIRQADMEEAQATKDSSEMRLPVIEEQLHVSKRAVEQGGVRIHTHITEEPVQKDVTVQEEQLHVERHPVNRPLGEQELNAFTEGTIEMTAMAEELVIEKVARVVEEVTIQKNVTEHTETIEESLRRSDVQVEGFNSNPEADQFAHHNQEIQAHYEQTYADSSYTYPQMVPAYRYGYTLANSAPYQKAHWNEIEAEVEQAWEKKNQGTWETFKEAIRYGWNRVRA